MVAEDFEYIVKVWLKLMKAVYDFASDFVQLNRLTAVMALTSVNAVLKENSNIQNDLTVKHKIEYVYSQCFGC